MEQGLNIGIIVRSLIELSSRAFGITSTCYGDGDLEDKEKPLFCVSHFAFLGPSYFGGKIFHSCVREFDYAELLSAISLHAMYPIWHASRSSTSLGSQIRKNLLKSPSKSCSPTPSPT